MMEPNEIFRKTAQGQAEIDSNERSLSMQERRLLILINGEKDAATLGKLSLCENSMEILDNLLEQGLIERVEIEPPQQPDGTDDSADDDVIDARDFLCNTLMSYGNRVRVKKLVEEIMAAEDTQALEALVIPWYQAVSDTPAGMYQADKLRDQVKAMIGAEKAAGSH
jgi:hypothetical protein